MTAALNVDLLHAFLAIAEEGSFTVAARRLDVLQSTVSQRIGRLEHVLGRPLLERDTHHVSLTPDGHALIDLARGLVEAHDRLFDFFSANGPRTILRLGVSEDFTLSALAAVLARFAAAHRSVDLQLKVGLSDLLYKGFDSGELDIIFSKRRAGDPRGKVVWKEPLVWVGRPGSFPDPAVPLPLVLYPPPSIIRRRAVEALEAARRPWRVACTSDSLMGLRAAAEAGLGVAPHSARLIPAGLAAIPASARLPPLGEIEFVVLGPGRQHTAATALAEELLASAFKLQNVEPIPAVTARPS